VTATAEAFGVVARDVRDATKPLTDSSVRVADSAQTISRAVADAASALSNGQNSAHTLANELKGHTERLQSFWSSYESRFLNVDKQLATSISHLGEHLYKQQQLVRDYTQDIDDGFTKAVINLNGAINNLGEQTEGVRDAMEQFARIVELQRVSA
jgi:ABC-type transporter Mla subunit MlaD